jgi:hypothetical protein
MRNITVLLLFLLTLTILVPVSAISIGNIAITPSGDLVSGVTRVSASFMVYFPPVEGTTFAIDHTLQMDTDLDNAVWIYSVYLDGIENPSKSEAGPNIRLSGWQLSYPSKREVSLKVRVEGTAPVVVVSKEQVVIRVRELNNQNVVISGSEVVKSKMVLNPTTNINSAASESAQLSAIKSRIDRLAAGGVRTSSLEDKYRQASALLQSAEITSDFARAQSDLTRAASLIDQLQLEVVILEAQKAIADAEMYIGETEDLITYFKIDKGMSSDSRLNPILSNWEIAAERLTAARDLYSEGNFEDAARKAGEAAAKGNKVLTDAQALKNEVDASSSLTSLPTQRRVKVTQTITTSDAGSSFESQQQEIIDRLNRQNQLLEEQNRKLSEQNNLLQNIIDMWNKFLRSIGLQ